MMMDDLSYIPQRSAPGFFTPITDAQGIRVPQAEDPTGDEAKLLADIDERFKSAAAFTDDSYKPAMDDLCEALLEGRHYLEWDKKNKCIKENETVKQHGVTVNYTRSQWRISRAKIHGGKRRLEAIPIIGTEQGRKAARLASQLVETWDYLHKTDQRNLVMAGLMLLYGKAFVRVYWDSSAITTLGLRVPTPDTPQQIIGGSGEYLGRVPHGGTWVDAYRGRYGDIAEEIRLPREVFVEPGVTSLDKADRFFVATLRNIGWIRQTFGDEIASRVKPEEIEDVRSPTGERYTAAFVTEYTPDALDGVKFSDEAGLVWVKECWRATNTGRWERILYVFSDQNPQGVWLNPGEPAWPHHGWVEFSLVENPATFWPTAPVWDWRDLQFQINLLYTMSQINAKQARKALLILQGEPKFEDRDAFYMVKLDQTPNPSSVTFDSIPLLAPQFMDMADRLYAQLQRISLINEISHARPSGVTSGTGLQKLQDEEMVVPNSYRRFLDDANAKVAEIKLMFARHFYTAEYLVGNVSGQGDAELITGDALPAVVRMSMVESNVLPEGRSARVETAMQMFTAGMFNPGNEEASKRVMQFINATGSDFDTLFPHGARNEDLIQKWIEKILAGTVGVAGGGIDPATGQPMPGDVFDLVQGRPLINDWMNHTELLQDLAERILTGETDEWNPQQIAVYDAIMQSLQNRISQQQMQQMNQQLAMQAAQAGPQKQRDGGITQ